MCRGKIVALDIGRALSYLHSRQPKVVHQVSPPVYWLYAQA